MWATSVIKKTALSKQSPMGENSPNLVTLKIDPTQYIETGQWNRTTQAQYVPPRSAKGH
jgi:hypothetical protein